MACTNQACAQGELPMTERERLGAFMVCRWCGRRRLSLAFPMWRTADDEWLVCSRCFNHLAVLEDLLPHVFERDLDRLRKKADRDG